MTTPKSVMWEIEPHTLAKHEILRRYLVAWFVILGKYNKSLLYIDGFCGPGRYLGGEVGSPIIALEEALKHKDDLKDVVHHFIFVDQNKDRIDQLKIEIANYSLPENYKVYTIVGEFDNELSNLLDSIEISGNQLPPTFAFIDPFGFKGLPFSIVDRLLCNQKSEVFVNIMADSINRWLDHPNEKTTNHIIELFGTEEVITIADTSIDRIADLRLLYQERLKTCAHFVRYFELRDCDNRTIYYLFFAGNHPLGHIKMKEAFWKVDTSSGYSFSDATNPDQLILFELDESPKLSRIIAEYFSGRKVTISEIIKYVEDDTAFLQRHMRLSLKLLESTDEITVNQNKSDGTKRRKNTFPPNAVVKFS